MRAEFAKQLHEQMAVNPDIYLITADLGYGILDKIKEDYPDRFFNVGAAEVAMVSIAVGLALSGKVPFCYSITPFLLFRPFETIRTYISHEKIPVILIGSGRGNDYEHDGFSHYAGDDDILMRLPHIYSIRNLPELKPGAVKSIIEMKMPVYLNLKR